MIQSSVVLKLFNTETRAKEEVTSSQGKKIRLYTCGPTIYNFAHIGNFRTYVFEDLLRRTLKWFGFDVEQVMNLTDVDDKTIRGALAEKVSLKTFTDRYKEAFFADIKALNIQPAEHYPAATDYLPQMIEMIQTLLDKGIAYRGADDSIYFQLSKFPRYGRLSHLEEKELKAGARVNSDEYDKENISDFVLWKALDKERDGNIYWESPFGPGRPGWHIECSAMASALLGKTVDIHVGGVDNMFPHHENEIAQSEGCFGCQFVRLWMHSEHLLVDHKKMSKSLGNFFTLRDLLAKGFTGLEVRYMLLQTHYRTQLNFTLAGLEGARSSVNRLRDFYRRVSEIAQPGACDAAFIEPCKARFEEALADDLNISAALAAFFDFVREINARIDAKKLSSQEAYAVQQFTERVDGILGVICVAEEEIPTSITEAAQQRQVARKEKRFADADRLRDEIAAQGYVIEDIPTGIRIKKR